MLQHNIPVVPNNWPLDTENADYRDHYDCDGDDAVDDVDNDDDDDDNDVDDELKVADSDNDDIASGA